MPNLSPAQSRVVGHPGGPLLVVAGPGTGKTTVLVERFARLVADGAHPESVLALVAAPAAARRLRALLEEAIDGAYEELAVHTVHDLCARILHDEALEAGLDPFVVPLGRATGWRCCSSTSTSCRCASTTSAAAPPRSCRASSRASTG